MNDWTPEAEARLSKLIKLSPHLVPCQDDIAAALRRIGELDATVKSIAVMLGWENVPPRESLEANLRANRLRLEQAEAQLAEAQQELAQMADFAQKRSDAAADERQKREQAEARLARVVEKVESGSKAGVIAPGVRAILLAAAQDASPRKRGLLPDDTPISVTHADQCMFWKTFSPDDHECDCTVQDARPEEKP
jgi:hypothetical protein